MTASTQIAQLVQQAETDAAVELFQIDVINGGGTYRWTPGPLDGAIVSFGGLQYTPLPIEATGFVWSGKGALAMPKLTVSNIAGLVGALLIGAGDIVGSTVTRTRTFRRYLDGQVEADPNQHLLPDIYRVERKSKQTKMEVEFELSAWIDQEGRMLPGRLLLREICTHTYRFYQNGAFNYTKASCPYTGAAMFDRNDSPTGDPTLDVCSKKLAGCKARFGATNPLPTRAFPGASRGFG